MMVGNFPRPRFIKIALLSFMWGCAPLPQISAEPQAGQVPQPLSVVDPSLRRDTLIILPNPALEQSALPEFSAVDTLPAFAGDSSVNAADDSDLRFTEESALPDLQPAFLEPTPASPAEPAPSVAPSAPQSDANATPSSAASDFALPWENTSAPAAAIAAQNIPPALRRDIRVGISLSAAKFTLACQTQCQISVDGAAPRSGTGALTATLSGSTVKIAVGSHGWNAQRQVVVSDAAGRENYVEINGKKYRGSMELRPSGGKIAVVNQLPVELYLQGVVPGEIGRLDSSMFAALETQAVAARTYAYRHFASRQSQGFDVFDDTRDQVYQGLSGEAPLANAAISATAGVVMLHQNQLIDAYYHSTCGGHTADLQTWGRSGLSYLQAVPDVDPQGKAWCQASSYSSWSFTYTWNELSAIVKAHLSKGQPEPLLNFNRITKVTVLDYLPGGRVGRVLYVTDQGNFTVWGDKNRWILRSPPRGDKTLPSAWFLVDQNPQGVTIQGKGFGHGIGMCQMGVRAKAKQGWDYATILQSYYPAVQLRQWR